MNKRKFIAATILFASLISIAAAENDIDNTVRIYLPRKSQIASDIIKLSDIAVVHGQGQIADEIRQVTLGRISLLGQSVVLNRETITGRLVSSGFKAGTFAFLGADEISVRQKIDSVTAQKIIEIAMDFVKTETKGANVCSIKPLTAVNDVAIKSDSNNLEFKPKLLDSSSVNRLKVAVEISSQGNVIASPEIAFGLKYKVNRIVTTASVAAGQAITIENTKIEEEIANFPEPDQVSLYGLVPKRDLAQGTALRANMLTTPVPVILVQRNQPVMIKSQRPGLVITATGLAMDNASVGQCIRVKNTDSQRIIVAKVNEDGTVEPVR